LETVAHYFATDIIDCLVSVAGVLVGDAGV